MELLELTLHNYKVHRRKTIKFEPGVVGIVGDNGSGKSSIISAICFLFTGEYDTARKSECITLGETEGWVRGKFRLNNKEGTIERHLNCSKVELTYDGVSYNKSGEVEELWNKLLQIDKTIFNNVIVAKQGEIQSLFSDETTTREKIFQKIFMVPPTEKIRNTIWDNYIKIAPPEKPEEDVVQLQTLQVNAATERNKILEAIELKLIELGDEALVNSINARISFLNQCIADVEKRPTLQQQLTALMNEHTANEEKLQQVKDWLSTQPSLSSLNASKYALLSIKPVYERKQSLVTEINKLDSEIEFTDSLSDIETSTALETKKADILALINEYNGSLKTLLLEKKHLLTLKDHLNCPTCKQPIPNREKYLQELMDREVELTGTIQQLNKEHSTVAKLLQELNSKQSKNQGLRQRYNYLQEELRKIVDTQFSAQELTDIEQSISNVQTATAVQQHYSNRQVEIKAERSVLQGKLDNLALYDGHASPEQELAVLNAAIEENKAIQSEINLLQLNAGKLEHELSLLDTRIATSETNHKYNTKRRAYLSKLEAVHDLFNVSKFPRKLIEAYMSNIQAGLAKYLAYFNLPFNIKVEDGFRIRLYDENNRQLPKVSGGQQIMVGLCLRLALHGMFAQAFSILILDEGTTHLDTNNRQNYFEVIRELRDNKLIDQVIVIDHDPGLASVVDQTIQL